LNDNDVDKNKKDAFFQVNSLEKLAEKEYLSTERESFFFKKFVDVQHSELPADSP
jgi:hypothetical protein